MCLSYKKNRFTLQSLIVVNFIGLVTVNAQGWLIDDAGCRTPGGGSGECVVIRDCKPIVDFILNSVTFTQSTIKLLQSYQCGYEASVKVCCPYTPLPIENPTATTGEPLVPPTPDISNHRNLGLLPLNCGLLYTSNRIVNGNKTALYEFPWMARLGYYTPGRPIEFKCGGTVINDRYVLTAAHCIRDLGNKRLIGVRIGEHNVTSTIDCQEQSKGVRVCAPPVQDIEIEEAISHPNYDSSIINNDIGLIRLKRSIVFLENAAAVCLPTTPTLLNQNFTGARLIVTGWGTTETGRNSEDLLKVDVPVVSTEDCQKTYEKSRARIKYNHLCAGGKNKRDSCGGDSGGPLQMIGSFDDDVRYIQFGIVSFGPSICGQENYPGVYTRTDYFMDWILDTIR